MRILLVEDSATLRFTMSAIIKSAGHEVLVVESGEAALQLVESTPVDLVIMDVEMPGLNGFETTRLMRENFGNHWVPIVFVTGMTDDKSFHEGIEAGGDDYMTKPVSPVILKAKIRALERIHEMQLELKRLNKGLEILSQRDPLTNLYNRRAFEQQAEHQWKIQLRNREPMAVLMVDVDHFKTYNDYYGHQAGDDCLAKVAKTLEVSLHRPADVIARYGGEEFVVMLPVTDEEGAKVVAKALQESIEALKIPHEKSSSGDYVTVSIGGAATIVNPGITFNELVKHADKSLYVAKNSGRNRYVVEGVSTSKTVLVVDDDEFTPKMVAAQLRDQCNVLTSNNGEDCIELAYNVLPDLILLDIHLPDLDGGKICQQLKENHRTQHIPIIFISSDDCDSQRQLAEATHADDFMQKPLDADIVIEMVRKHLHG